MVKKVMIHRKHNVAVKRYIAISRKTDKVVAGSDTRKGLAKALKKKRVGNFFIIENAKVREANLINVKKATLEHWKKSEEAKRNLKKGYLHIF